MSRDLHELAAFLIEAKRRTYAGLDDDATVVDPLLRGSKQLEYRADPYAYRDIYFGMGFFVGQETVSKDEKVVWSMCYSGGAQPAIADRTETSFDLCVPSQGSVGCGNPNAVQRANILCYWRNDVRQQG